MRTLKTHFTTILLASTLFSCGHPKQESTSHKNSLQNLSVPVASDRFNGDVSQTIEKFDCSFLDPDTSILSLSLRDSKSGADFIKGDQQRGEEDYRYYSKNCKQLLSLTQHPGDNKYQISIIKVEYAKKDDYGYRRLNVDTLKTEKGIMLGMSKYDVIDRLGNCYIVIDSTKEYMVLRYQIEARKVSKTHLLATHNMPSYSASYSIRNGTLEKFEFGFEYP